MTVNYRLGIFGFGQGEEIAKNGAANLGLKDVRLALDWVQENIWAFGGNPGQVCPDSYLCKVRRLNNACLLGDGVRRVCRSYPHLPPLP